MDKVEVVLGDLANLDAFNVEDTIDTIIHAGARTDHFGDDENFIHVNVQSTEALLALAHQHQAKFIYISTISVGAVFDVHTEDKAFSEKMFINNNYLRHLIQKVNSIVKSKF